MIRSIIRKLKMARSERRKLALSRRFDDLRSDVNRNRADLLDEIGRRLAASRDSPFVVALLDENLKILGFHPVRAEKHNNIGIVSLARRLSADGIIIAFDSSIGPSDRNLVKETERELRRLLQESDITFVDCIEVPGPR